MLTCSYQYVENVCLQLFECWKLAVPDSHLNFTVFDVSHASYQALYWFRVNASKFNYVIYTTLYYIESWLSNFPFQSFKIATQVIKWVVSYLT